MPIETINMPDDDFDYEQEMKGGRAPPNAAPCTGKPILRRLVGIARQAMRRMNTPLSRSRVRLPSKPSASGT